MIEVRVGGGESKSLAAARAAVNEELEAAVAEDGNALPEERTRFAALQYEPAIEFALVAAFEAGKAAK